MADVMRISPEITEFLRMELANIPSPSRMFLFGSRTSDEAKGGDIDILILSESKIERSLIRQIRIRFYKHFRFQKLDLVNFSVNEESAFRDLILENAILIAANAEE